MRAWPAPAGRFKADRADFMNSRHYLCSQLVALRNRSGESLPNLVVNLEEIWEDGAVLESEQPAELGARVEIRCDRAFFAGRIVQVKGHQFGWRIEVEFSPMTPWKPEQFRPEHLLDLSQLDS
jgi:hypothetical protein